MTCGLNIATRSITFSHAADWGHEAIVRLRMKIHYCASSSNCQWKKIELLITRLFPLYLLTSKRRNQPFHNSHDWKSTDLVPHDSHRAFQSAKKVSFFQKTRFCPYWSFLGNHPINSRLSRLKWFGIGKKKTSVELHPNTPKPLRRIRSEQEINGHRIINHVHDFLRAFKTRHRFPYRLSSPCSLGFSCETYISLLLQLLIEILSRNWLMAKILKLVQHSLPKL